MSEKESNYLFDDLPVIKGFPELRWTGKRPFKSAQYYPAQLKESYGNASDDGWMNKIFWGDNLQVMSHLLKEYRGKIDLVYIDPPFDSKADYKKKIEIKGIGKAESDSTSFEEKQYGDIWSSDEYLQFMYERLILLRELLSDKGTIYLHCDWHKSHHLRMILDEIFSPDCFRNEIIWSYSTLGRPIDRFAQKHDSIFVYGKTNNTFFNVDDAKIPYSTEYIKSHFKDIDENGKQCRKRFDAGKWRTYYPDQGMIPNDVWDIPYENSMSLNRLNYPTQKPEALLERIIKSSTKIGDLVFDCFMGSGTTQSVAMKLGRRFIGADINLGSIQTTTKRLLNVAKKLDSAKDQSEKKYTGFEVYNVNNYDIFRNPIEARELLIKALEIQPAESTSIWDGELDGRMVKIMPVNRIATKADVPSITANLPYTSYESRKADNPKDPVERITIICMGHEPDFKAAIEQELGEYKVDIEIVDILRDKQNLTFKREPEAEIVKEGNKLVIRQFFPMNLLQKLSLQKESVEDWRQLVESVMIDFNYDGVVLQPSVIDIPDKKTLVSGVYDIPEDAGSIKVKITDLLSESLEMEI